MWRQVVRAQWESGAIFIDLVVNYSLFRPEHGGIFEKSTTLVSSPETYDSKNDDLTRPSISTEYHYYFDILS